MSTIPHVPSEKKKKKAHAQPSKCLTVSLIRVAHDTGRTCATPLRSNLGCQNTIHPIKLMLLTCKFVWFVTAQQLLVQAFQNTDSRALSLKKIHYYTHSLFYGGLDPQPGWKTSAPARSFKNLSGPHVTALSFIARISIFPLLSYPLPRPLRSAPKLLPERL